MTFQWRWSLVGNEGGKQGRVYNFPLTFGPGLEEPEMMEQKSEALAGMAEILDLMEEDGDLDTDTKTLLLDIARGAKIVSAITR